MAIVKQNKAKRQPKKRRNGGKRKGGFSPAYAYRNGVSPWMHNPAGDDIWAAMEQEVSAEAGSAGPARSDEEEQIIVEEVERQRKRRRRDVKKLDQLGKPLLSTFARVRFGRESRQDLATAQKNLQKFLTALNAQTDTGERMRREWSKRCVKVYAQGKPEDQVAKLRKLVQFIVQSHLPEPGLRRLSLADAVQIIIKGTICEDPIERDLETRPETVQQVIDLVNTGHVEPGGNTVKFDLTKWKQDEDPDLPPPGEVPTDADLDAGMFGGDEDDEYMPGPDPVRPSVVAAEERLLKEGQQKKWSGLETKVQKRKYDERLASSPGFARKKALFDPYWQFLELTKRTIPVPPAEKFVEAIKKEDKNADFKTFARGSIILVVRWNGNTQVIIPSYSTSTVLTKRGSSSYTKGLPTWFPIAEFITRWDLKPEAEVGRFGGDFTSLGQAYRFSMSWRTHDPRNDKYKVYPVYMFTEDTRPRGDTMESQEKMKLTYLGKREPPTAAKYVMKGGGRKVAERILRDEIDAPMGPSAPNVEDFFIDEEEFDVRTNRRRRRLQNRGRRIRRNRYY
jgi:hypothetical protein